MRRTLVIAFGLLEIVAPGVIVDYGERLAFENPNAGRLRPWTLPMARLEGIAFCWVVAREAGLPTALETALAVYGLVLALLPRTVVELNLELAYENADELEVKRWVVPATRLLGVVYLIAGLFARRVDAPTDADVAHRD
ncbi:hypothetical protein [Natrinema ejinorense]|uniref:Uncharacterized protein n=1 Tax=Natrinema ejinorense TaxID=373386 RepID=A0A2A5QYU5_9EURY|nr:hypothetical protein [Natrinema ejinorense]PCR91974.1 hypothetical protein CP557_16465 [Natrinema ejinorense]